MQTQRLYYGCAFFAGYHTHTKSHVAYHSPCPPLHLHVEYFLFLRINVIRSATFMVAAQYRESQQYTVYIHARYSEIFWIHFAAQRQRTQAMQSTYANWWGNAWNASSYTQNLCVCTLQLYWSCRLPLPSNLMRIQPTLQIQRARHSAHRWVELKKYIHEE